MKIKFSDDVEVSIDMSPMIDMVFLLLIFFIVASAMVDLDKPEVSIPAASEAKVAEDAQGRLNLSIDAQEQIYVGAQPVTLDELKARVTSELESNPDLRLFIRADEEVPYQVTKELMTACAAVGAINLIYATFEE